MQRKLTLVFLLLFVFEFSYPCIIHELFMGYNPYFNRHSIGILYNYRQAAENYTHVHPDGTVHTHYKNEQWADYEVRGRIFLNSSFQVIAGVNTSMLNATMQSVHAYGLLNYRVFQTSNEHAKIIQRLIAGAGINAPLTDVDYAGIYSSPLSLNYVALAGKTGINAEGNLNVFMNVKGKSRPGNSLNGQLSIFRLMKWRQASLIPSAGLSYAQSFNERTAGREMLESGSRSLFYFGGLSMYFKNISLNFMYYLPAWQDAGPEEAKWKQKFQAGLTWSFNQKQTNN